MTDSIPPISPLKSFFAGGFGGICCIVSGYPMDTIKVRLQTMALPNPGELPLYTGTVDCTMQTIRKEGVFGLFKGMGAPILLATPQNMVAFFGYNLGKKLQLSEIHGPLSKPQLFQAGLFSGFLASIVTAPAERIKCLLQVQSNTKGPPKYNGPADCARKLLREGGMRSLYKGFGATLARDGPGYAFYFASYEWLKEIFALASGSEGKLNPLQIMVAGGLGGIVMWIYATPPDVLKSRLQAGSHTAYPHGMRSVFKELMRTEGPLALYKGVVPVMLRAFPANGACFLGYEVAMKFLNWIAPNW